MIQLCPLVALISMLTKLVSIIIYPHWLPCSLPFWCSCPHWPQLQPLLPSTWWSTVHLRQLARFANQGHRPWMPMPVWGIRPLCLCVHAREVGEQSVGSDGAPNICKYVPHFCQYRTSTCKEINLKLGCRRTIEIQSIKDTRRCGIFFGKLRRDGKSISLPWFYPFQTWRNEAGYQQAWVSPASTASLFQWSSESWRYTSMLNNATIVYHSKGNLSHQ